MPTKLNHAGNQQNYIPAGNGDASGEYGDNATGSNKHFTNFKKPLGTSPKQTVKKETSKTEGINAPEQNQSDDTKGTKKEIDKTIWNELSKVQKKKIGEFLLTTGRTKESILEALRYYTGTFGDLSKYSDEQLNNLIDTIKNNSEYLNEKDYNQQWYKKEGSKWVLTRYKNREEFLGNKLYTIDEYHELEKEKNQQLVKDSQSKADKEIQNSFGKGCVVCFGKGYKEEELLEISTATRTLINDFDGLKEYVKQIGDRTNLEKYINAINSQKEFTEEEIQAKEKEIASYYFFGAPTGEQLRQKALASLRGNVSIPRLNRAYAYWQDGSRRMIFMPKMKDAKESKKRDFEANWSSSDTSLSVYYHEMGHAIDYMINNAYNKLYGSYSGNIQKQYQLAQIKSEFERERATLEKQNFNNNYNSEFEKLYKEKYNVEANDFNQNYTERKMREETIKSELRNKGIVRFNVGKYATTNTKEFVAECFGAFYSNMNNSLADNCINLYKRFYKQIKEFK